MPGRDGCICDECAEQAYLLSEEYLHKKKKAWEFWIVQSENREKVKLLTRALADCFYRSDPSACCIQRSKKASWLSV